jgi:phosphatidate cytidylyltransferase
VLTRIITAIIGIPLVVLIVVSGSPVLSYTMVTVSCLGLYELFNTIKKTYNPIQYIGYGGLLVYFLFFDIIYTYYSVYLALLIIITLIVMVIKYPKYSITDAVFTIFAPLYIGLLFSFIILTRNLEYGAFWVWLIVISSWGSDTFAYFSGVFLGKHKLAPQLSPKKTIEGSIGGVIGAGAIGYIYTAVYTAYDFGLLKDSIGIVVIIVIIGSIVSQFGDLAASAIKRFFNQKDFGHILPGHGGILDRCDSLLLVAPVVYIAVMLAEKMIR